MPRCWAHTSGAPRPSIAHQTVPQHDRHVAEGTNPWQPLNDRPFAPPTELLEHLPAQTVVSEPPVATAETEPASCDDAMRRIAGLAQELQSLREDVAAARWTIDEVKHTHARFDEAAEGLTQRHAQLQEQLNELGRLFAANRQADVNHDVAIKALERRTREWDGLKDRAEELAELQRRIDDLESRFLTEHASEIQALDEGINGLEQLLELQPDAPAGDGPTAEANHAVR